MNLEHKSVIEIAYADEINLKSFHSCLDSVAREKIYIEMIEAWPFEKIAEHQKKLIQTNFPSYQAIYENRVIGWADISGSLNPRYAHRGFLGMGIIDRFRGQGLGSRLLAAALDHARKIGLEKVELEVYTTNAAAISLYKKHGFVEVGCKRKNRKLDERYFDIYLMDLFLK